MQAVATPHKLYRQFLSDRAHIGVRAKRAAGGGLQPHDSVKAIIFRAKAKFFGQMPAAKSEKNNGNHSV